MDDQDNIIEGELAEEGETPTPTQTAKDGDAVVLVNLESLIKSHLATIDKLQRVAREHKETLDNILLNDPTYKQHDDAAKEANKVKSGTRQEIMKRTDVKQVVEKLKSAKSELGELQDELPEYLSEYQRLSNSNIILGENGEELQIVSTAKLVKVSSQSR